MKRPRTADVAAHAEGDCGPGCEVCEHEAPLPHLPGCTWGGTCRCP